MSYSLCFYVKPAVELTLPTGSRSEKNRPSLVRTDGISDMFGAEPGVGTHRRNGPGLLRLPLLCALTLVGP